MGETFIVICQQVVGGSNGPFEIVYDFDGREFKSRPEAIKHGFSIRESDDFNIGVVRKGKVVSLDWMHEVVDNAPEELAEINAQVFP